jgi:hypothetical protein
VTLARSIAAAGIRPPFVFRSWGGIAVEGVDDRQCVEIADEGDRVAIRNSREPEGPRLYVSHESWAEFLAAIKRGEFDRLP